MNSIFRQRIPPVGSSGANSNIELYRRVDGEFEPFPFYGGVDVLWPRGNPRQVRVHVVGDEIYVYFAGELVLQATDDTFAGGALGLRHNSEYDQPVSVRYRSLHWGTF
jgi:hypothetical protein